MDSKTRWLLLLIYFVLGLYLVNISFPFVDLPDFGDVANKWISFVCGVLLVIGGFTFFKVSNPRSVY